MKRARKRPLAFGARLREGDRTLRVEREGQAYTVEDGRRGSSTKRRTHPSLESALRDLASTWRGRLN